MSKLSHTVKDTNVITDRHLKRSTVMVRTYNAHTTLVADVQSCGFHCAGQREDSSGHTDSASAVDLTIRSRHSWRAKAAKSVMPVISESARYFDKLVISKNPGISKTLGYSEINSYFEISLLNADPNNVE
jgi:hypothetical protein